MKKLLLASLLVSTNSFTKIQKNTNNTPTIVDPFLKVTDTVTDLTAKTVEKIKNDIPKKIEPYKKNGIGRILWTAFFARYFREKEIKETPL